MDLTIGFCVSFERMQMCARKYVLKIVSLKKCCNFIVLIPGILTTPCVQQTTYGTRSALLKGLGGEAEIREL